MDREESVDLIIDVITDLIKLQNFVGDTFFYSEFNNKTRNLVRSYFKFFSENPNNVAQYTLALKDILVSLDNFVELISYLEYLKVIELSPTLLLNKKNLLNLKLKVIKSENNAKRAEIKDKFKNYKPNSINTETVTEKPKKISQNLNPSKQKILEFIRHNPNKRTKDIIYEFNALSDRTVKRNLTELLRAGLIEKKADSKAVYYFEHQ